MRAILGIIVGTILIGTQLEACVTYNPSTGTYTVDKSGCVKQGRSASKSKR